MTYEDLKHHIESLSPEQMKMNVTVYDSQCDEFYPADYFLISDEIHIDQLDNKHPYISI